MSIKTEAIKLFAAHTKRSIDRWRKTASEDQAQIMHQLVSKAKYTRFGHDHDFASIRSYEDFKNQVPIRDYEGIRPYINNILDGEKNILWPGRPRYFAKTSGTTSGIKYIPLTDDSMPNHIVTARNAMMNYIDLAKRADIFEGKVIFLSGSPELEIKSGIPTGRLSGIVHHEIPSWVKTNQLPSFSTNTIEDWEEKLEKIVEETLRQDMRLISGIPPWVQMYYERILEKTGKNNIREVFPNFSLFMYGGVNFQPYRATLENLTGGPVDSIETFPASEGFIAFQDCLDSNDLLLNTRSGIFFEFVPMEEVGTKNPTRYCLSEVEKDKDYALIINNNAGLWGYSIGDCVRFVSLDPYRLIVSGRVSHFISAFGEHVIGKEVEEALLQTLSGTDIKVVEFTVAPQVNPPHGGQPYHEWFIEFDKLPDNLENLENQLDAQMCIQNIYYEDLIKGNILRKAKITPLHKDAFRNYMKSLGKLGGQNKVPRLANDRKIADVLAQYRLD